MPKRQTKDIKNKALFVLREKPATYAQLERKLNTGYRTVRAICEDLEVYGQVEVKHIRKHPSNGRPAYEVHLTSHGHETLKKLKK